MSSFKSMLAGKCESIADLQFPLLASPKLDGIRAHIIDGVVYSRNMKPFPNVSVQGAFAKRDLNGLDGEFICGHPTAPAAFRETGSCVMSRSGSIDNLCFHVFDDFTLPTVEFQHRLRTAHHRARKYSGLFAPVQHDLIASAEELALFEAAALADGDEGVMVRSLDGLYKYGRSTAREGWLLKVKQFEDSEFVIDECFELMHNQNERGEDGKRSSHKAGKVPGDKLGGMKGRDIHHGGPVEVGSGFNDEERQVIWRLWKANPDNVRGKIGKYKFFPTGSKDRPRFPTWEGFRDPIDL